MTIESLYQRSRTFIFSTGHHPPMVATGLIAALDLLERQPERLQRLWVNADAFRTGLRRLGYSTGVSTTPIVPVIAGDAPRAMALARELRSEGVYVQAFSYPVAPKGAARVCCILSAAHTREVIDEALAAFTAVGQRLRLI